MNSSAQKFDVFLSYHWRDHEQVERLARRLRDQNLKVFLDRWYLTPGVPWPQALEQTLRSCGAVAVCLGPGEMGPWQQREANLALERQAREALPVIPVLLPGAEPVLGFLKQNTWVDLRQQPEDPKLLTILAKAIRGEAPGPDLQEQVAATLASICPYRGLRFFREEDAAFFFGREEPIKKLKELVEKQPFVAVVGASGCGKSSVVRAGLAHQLRGRAGNLVWEVATFVPTDRPLHQLGGALMQFLEPQMTETDRLVEVGKFANILSEAKPVASLRDFISRILDKQPGTERLLLVVDQWEELYTLTKDEKLRRRFIDEILDASNRGRLHVVITMRGDFYGHALAYRPLSDRLQDRVVNLPPMNRAELEQATREPADKVGLSFQPGLVERIINDVGDEPGNLPLLEFMLERLWQERRGGQLLHDSYESMGGLQGALAKKADDAYGRFSEVEKQAIQRIFLQLVHPGASTEDTRRRAFLSEIPEPSKPLVKALADERLLVTGSDLASRAETVEVSHEALIRNWGMLKTWVDQDREFLLWLERLRSAKAEWVRASRDKTCLLRGPLLAEAERWLGARGDDLSTDECTFIRASIKNRKHRIRVQGAVAAVIFLILALISAWQYRELEIERAKRRPIEPEMVIIEPGQFTMGSSEKYEGPPHEVFIKKRFEIGRFEVTFEEFDKFAYDTGLRAVADMGWGGGNRPVINVSWEEAMKYAEWLSKKTGKDYRLPTEAEWEYAARAGTETVFSFGTETAFSFGEDVSKLREYAWYSDNSGGKTHPVGEKKPNAWGLYDMHGNVWEWVEDDWHNSYDGAPKDGSAWVDRSRGSFRVLRGGSWDYGAEYCRSARRGNSAPGDRDDDLGFRLSRSVALGP